MEAWFRWFSDFSRFQFGAFLGSMLIFRGVTIAYHYWPVKIAIQTCPPAGKCTVYDPAGKKRQFRKVFVEAPRKNQRMRRFPTYPLPLLDRGTSLPIPWGFACRARRIEGIRRTCTTTSSGSRSEWCGDDGPTVKWRRNNINSSKNTLEKFSLYIYI